METQDLPRELRPRTKSLLHAELAEKRWPLVCDEAEICETCIGTGIGEGKDCPDCKGTGLISVW